MVVRMAREVAEFDGRNDLEAGLEAEGLALGHFQIVDFGGRNRIEIGGLEGGAQVGRKEGFDELLTDLVVKMLAHQLQRRLAGAEAGDAGLALEAGGDAVVLPLHLASGDFDLKIALARVAGCQGLAVPSVALSTEPI